MSYNARTLQEVVIGECPAVSIGAMWPISAETMCGQISGYCPDLGVNGGDGGDYNAQWATLLKYCLFDITFYAEGNPATTINQWSKMKFSNADTFVNFVNGQLPHFDWGSGEQFTSSCMIKVYNIVDGTVPVIGRIGSYNKFFKCLMGGNNRNATPFQSLYHAVDPSNLRNNFNNTRAMFNMGTQWDAEHPTLAHGAIETFVKTAWEKVWGIIPGTDGYPDYNDSDETRRAYLGSIWFPLNSNQGNLYRLPASGVGLQIHAGQTVPPSGLVRNVVDVSDKATGDAYVAARDEYFTIEKFAICYIPLVPKLVDDGADIWNNHGLYTGGFGWRDQTQSGIQWEQTGSTVIIYGVQSGDRRALYIKPFGGPDSFCLPHFDDSQYRLEMLVSQKEKKEKLVVLDIAADGYIGGHKLYQFVIRKPAESGWTNTQNNNYLRSGVDIKCRFYLRKIDSEYVSEVSPVFIHRKFNPYGQRVAPISYSVEYDR